MLIFRKILELLLTSILFPVEAKIIKLLFIIVVMLLIFILLKSLILNNKILTFSKIVVAVPIFNFSNDYIVILLVFTTP